jgi:hypothetical protein
LRGKVRRIWSIVMQLRNAQCCSCSGRLLVTVVAAVVGELAAAHADVNSKEDLMARFLKVVVVKEVAS